MELPRDISGLELVKRVRTFGYEPTHQAGSHIRCTTQRGGEHHLSIPNHKSVKIGTLKQVVRLIAGHTQIAPDEVARRLFG